MFLKCFLLLLLFLTFIVFFLLPLFRCNLHAGKLAHFPGIVLPHKHVLFYTPDSLYRQVFTLKHPDDDNVVHMFLIKWPPMARELLNLLQCHAVPPAEILLYLHYNLSGLRSLTLIDVLFLLILIYVVLSRVLNDS